MALDFIVPGTIKQGYLTKSPPLEKSKMKQWKKRFFILYRSGDKVFLQYYENEEAAQTNVPIDVVALKGCLGIESNLVHKTYKNLFSVQLPHRTYYFSALTEREMNEWVTTFCTALGFCPPKNEVSPLSRPLPPVPASTRSLPPLPPGGPGTLEGAILTSDQRAAANTVDFMTGGRSGNLYMPVETQSRTKSEPESYNSLHMSPSLPPRIF